jgi:hypothetical protein
VTAFLLLSLPLGYLLFLLARPSGYVRTGGDIRGVARGMVAGFVFVLVVWVGTVYLGDFFPWLTTRGFSPRSHYIRTLIVDWLAPAAVVAILSILRRPAETTEVAIRLTIGFVVGFFVVSNGGALVLGERTRDGMMLFALPGLRLVFVAALAVVVSEPIERPIGVWRLIFALVHLLVILALAPLVLAAGRFRADALPWVALAAVIVASPVVTFLVVASDPVRFAWK